MGVVTASCGGGKGLAPPAANQVLLEEMAMYAEKVDVTALMQHYLKRILLDMPQDPLAYLIKEIEERPYKPEGHLSAPDIRPQEVKSKYMDLRDENVKRSLLQEIFTLCSRVGKEAGVVRKSEMVVMLSANPAVLLQRFPLHVNELKQVVQRADCEREGILNLEEFLTPALQTLSLPGGR